MMLTVHAQRALVRRGIPLFVVALILENPEQRLRVSASREVWQSMVYFGDTPYVVRVVIDLSDTPCVVTVYRSSNVRKYWEEVQ